MILNRRLAAVVVVVATAGVMAPVGASIAPSALAAVPSTHGWSTVPVAARAPIAAALAQDDAFSSQYGLNQSALTPTDTLAVQDSYGNAVAVSGTTIAIGADNRKVGNNAAQGVVYVFSRPTPGWRHVHQVATLTAPDGGAGEMFGYSVAIDGKTIVVSAIRHEVGTHVRQGAGYVFTEPATGWKTTSHPSSELTVADGAAYDYLGIGSAIAGDTIVLGATGANSALGAAYVFTKPTTGWTPHTSPIATLTRVGQTTNDYFGAHIAMSGTTIVVGAQDRYNNAGRAYLYLRPVAGWKDATETSVLAGSQQNNGYFGVSVAISGNTVVVGEPGTTVNTNDDVGSVFVFTRPAGGWAAAPTATAKLLASNGLADDAFGSSASIAGGRILVTADDRTVGTNADQGNVYLFQQPQAGWSDMTETGSFVVDGGQERDGLGSEVAQTSSAIVLGVSSRNTNTGGAYVFAPPGPVMSALKQSHKKWKLGAKAPRANPAHKPGGGTTFSFSLTQAATVSLAFTEKVGKKTRHKGTLKLAGRSGRNRIYFDGKIGPGKKLVAGACTVVISATSAAGSTRHKTLHFRTTNPKKRRHAFSSAAIIRG